MNCGWAFQGPSPPASIVRPTATSPEAPRSALDPGRQVCGAGLPPWKCLSAHRSAVSDDGLSSSPGMCDYCHPPGFHPAGNSTESDGIELHCA